MQLHDLQSDLFCIISFTTYYHLRNILHTLRSIDNAGYYGCAVVHHVYLLDVYFIAESMQVIQGKKNVDISVSHLMLLLTAFDGNY